MDGKSSAEYLNFACNLPVENKKRLNLVVITLLSRFYRAQNRSNQMKGYALLWKQVRVLEKLITY